MSFVLSLRPVTVTTLVGHTIPVPASKATFVPDMALARAIELGCVECTEDGKLIMTDDLVPKIPVSDIPQLTLEERDDQAKRAEVLLLAVSKLYQENDRAKFSKITNLPLVGAVSELTGFPTSAKEIAAAIEKFHAGT